MATNDRKSAEEVETWVKHDWDCTAVGEKGYYRWVCKGCGRIVPYPSPSDRFPKDECPNFLRTRRAEGL